MEKSIESIWKEGFLEKDALVAPKINDLYNQKSTMLVDQFRKMYTANLVGLVIFSCCMLLISFPVGMQYMGVPLFFIFIGLVIYSKKHLDTGDNIDKNSSSYEYLRSYDNWLKGRIAAFTKIYKYVYPLIYLSIVSGFWFLDFGDEYLGEIVVGYLLEFFPNMHLIFGVPVIGIVLVAIITGLVAYFSERMYLADVEILYGSLMNKLKELIEDMEELRK